MLNCNSFAEKIPLKDFFKNPVSGAFLVSPNGQMLAYLKPWEGRMNLFVRSLNKPDSEQRLTSNKDRDIHDFFWKENNIFYFKDFGGDENFHLYQVDVEKKTEEDITPFEKTRVELVDDLKYSPSNEILIMHNRRDAKVFDVYKLNIKNKKLDLLLQNPGDYESFAVDFKGQIRTVTRSVGTDTEILYRPNNNSPFVTLIKFDYTRSFQPVLFPENQKTLLAFSNLDRDKISLVSFNTESKKEDSIIYQHTDYDTESSAYGSPLIYSAKKKKILGLNILTWKLEQTFFDKEAEQLLQNIKEQSGLKKSNAYILSMDKSETIYTVLLSSDRVRAQYYLYDKKTNKISFLDSAMPWLKPDELSEMKPVQFTSRDGLSVHGYLTLPKNYSGKPISTVINPHGGPWHRDMWRYNGETQFLANRGYAVLQINFRGSTGYGREFWMSSFKQWGLKMQDDVTDGTQWLIQQGIANSKKICIYGGSYGGYATLMGLVKEPKLYACGVDYVGVSNLFTFLNTIPPYWSTYLEKIYAMLGHPENDKEQFIKTSPALNVDKIKSPLLIVQGAKDPRVNKNESDQVVNKLKERGIDVPYLVKENEGHGFRNEENRIEFYEKMEQFFEKYL